LLRLGPFTFKQADCGPEFEQIHRLNYRTFVSEIAQHADPGQERLVDKFHAKNTYFIVIRDERVVGMVSCHDQPPFSVAERLPEPELLRRPDTRPLEVRLLAIEPGWRQSTLFFGLLWVLYDHALVQGYTHLFISGLKERLPLYRRLGLEPLGPAVRSGEVYFVPMVLTIGHLPGEVERTKRRWEMHLRHESRREDVSNQANQRSVCLLPGPVTTSRRVREAFQAPSIYHRGPEFIGMFQEVRNTLAQLAGAKGCALFNGSGTLANEAVAAALAATQTEAHGILLVNGEFGRRLATQALRFGLKPRLLEWSWGQPWDLEEVQAALAEEPSGSWIWGVHQESSTGVLNDLPGLVDLAQRRGIRVCCDCISSLGAVPVDLRGVYLAAGATGKSLGAYAGVAIVFADAAQLATLDVARIPSYLDIPAALASNGPRFTFPSPTLLALRAALADYVTEEKARARFQHYEALGEYVRRRLRQLHLNPLASEERASPVVTTFTPPGQDTSAEFVTRCQSWGFAIGGQSQYLASRRLVQLATMGDVALEEVARFFDHLEQWLTKPSANLPCLLS
jgi:aspartate aminotransferase-like enzyme